MDGDEGYEVIKEREEKRKEEKRFEIVFLGER